MPGALPEFVAPMLARIGGVFDSDEHLDAVWLEPRLFCKVGYLERTVHGGLRAPVFLELVADGEG